MKKVTSKQIFSGVLVAGIALCLLVYLMVFTKYNDQKAALEKSNKDLQEQVDELKGYYDDMQFHQTQIASMKDAITILTYDYSSEANEEDFIMTAVAMQQNAIINYEKINIDTEEVIHTIPQETVTGAKMEELENQIEFFERKASYANTTDYANLKKCIEEVYKSNQKVGVDAISYKRESESNNFIKGTIDITYYTIQGMGDNYEPPKMDSYLKGGITDMFGKLVTDEDEEGNSSAEEE